MGAHFVMQPLTGEDDLNLSFLFIWACSLQISGLSFRLGGNSSNTWLIVNTIWTLNCQSSLINVSDCSYRLVTRGMSARSSCSQIFFFFLRNQNTDLKRLKMTESWLFLYCEHLFKQFVWHKLVCFNGKYVKWLILSGLNVVDALVLFFIYVVSE